MFTWENADQLMIDYLEENREKIADANALIRETKKFVREQAKETVTVLPNHQRLTLLDITVRKNQSEEFNIKTPKRIIPVIINEESPMEEQMAVGSESSIVIDVKKIRKNAEMRKK